MLFSKLEEAGSNLGVEDYSVSQNTLDNVSIVFIGAVEERFILSLRTYCIPLRIVLVGKRRICFFFVCLFLLKIHWFMCFIFCHGGGAYFSKNMLDKVSFVFSERNGRCLF